MNEEFAYDYDDYEVDDDDEYYAVRPNKTQLKKDIGALFALGEELSELPAAQLAALGLPEALHKAIADIAGMPHKGARKRQLKFIAGQMHKMDILPHIEKLAQLRNQSAHAVREHHIAERWRDKLLAEGDDVLAELLNEHPRGDKQQLRQLIRNAQKEKETGKPPKSYRLLYRNLKELFQSDDETVQNEQTDEDENSED